MSDQVVPDGWKVVPIPQCFRPKPVGFSIPQIASSSVLKRGRFPVIGQGQSFVEGFCDSADMLFPSKLLPVIIFGPHTRVIKAVKTPFVSGPNVRYLWPRDDYDFDFIALALQAVRIPSRGYNDHFPVLKQMSIPIPPREEQKLIAKALSCLQEALELEERTLQHASELKSAAMRELFTRGLRGEPQKETEIGPVPESWEEMPIGGLGKVVTGTTPPTKRGEFYEGGEIPFITPGDFEHGNAIVSTQKLITQAGLAVSRPLREDSTCVVCIGSSIGKVGITTAPISTTNQQINAIEARGDFIPRYVFHLLTYYSDHIRAQASPSPVPILSKGAFEQIALYASRDRDEQRQISAILDAIDRKIELHRRKRAVLEELFKSLLHKLMTGEVRVADLNLSALDQVAERAEGRP